MMRVSRSLLGAVFAAFLLFVLVQLEAHAQHRDAIALERPPVQAQRRVLPPDGDPPAYNGAVFASQSVPGTMKAGAVYTVTVNMVNRGTTSWTTARAYALGSRNPYDNVTWGGGRVGLAGPVAPGQTASFAFNVTAPAAPGSYNFQWAMVQDGVEWFGPPSDNVVVNVLALENNAQFVSQAVPAAMTAGQAYTVNVVMRNTGETTWAAHGDTGLASANPLANATWSAVRIDQSSSTAPGETASYAFQVTAPAAPGVYNFQWKMVKDGVAWFGAPSENVLVTVNSAPRNGAAALGIKVSPLVQGQNATVSVTMQNTGSTTWPAGGNYKLGAKNPDENLTWGVQRVDLANDVAPGQQTTFTFPITAPAAGAYTMQWQMMQRSIEWFGEIASAAVTVAPPAPPTDGTVTYIHTDALGSPVARTDSAGNIISRTSYEPYGRTAGGVTPTIGFTGHVNDADTGLVYMQQRYYDPVAGRFLSVDPVVTDANTGSSFNRYAYANNSPYKYIDPDGRAVESVTMDKNKNVHIVVGMSYKGAVTPKQADAFNKAIVNAYSGKKGDYAVNVTIIPSEQAKLGNYVTVVDGTKQSTTSGVGARETTLYTNDPAGATKEQVMTHEFGHLAGAFDKYDSSGAPNLGYENNIMGSAKSGKVDERTINEILKRNPPEERKQE